MKPQGLAHVEAAKADGRWQLAYSPPSQAKAPSEFIANMKKDKAAWAFYQTLNKANVYAIIYRLQTAKKPETRQRRMDQIMAMLSQRKAFH
jgi:uncharacterized protein YdeI (YjbR/CyaY-like superfamily)